MRVFASVFLVLTAAAADSPGFRLWNDLKAKRGSLAGIHQQFDVSRIYRSQSGSQASKFKLVLDISGRRWREASLTGARAQIRVFDGNDICSMEDGGDEFVRIKRHPKDRDPEPSPYSIDADWTKAVATEQRPCTPSPLAHSCTEIDVPMKPWVHSNGPAQTRMFSGAARLFVDTETGLLVSVSTVETIGTGFGDQRINALPRRSYELQMLYTSQGVTNLDASEPSLFAVPNGFREVREFSAWSADKIAKKLTGKPAPDLSLTDIEGKQLTLADFQGRVVLLDFWATWCPPCVADAPALDKLYQRNNGRDLMIVAVSVGEDRPTVERFLKANPHSFPVVLASENEMPLSYRVSAIPTYVVIDRDGSVASAVDGDQGLSKLRKLLQKAGLEIE